MQLGKISGAVVFLFVFLSLSVFVLFVEMMLGANDVKATEVRTHDLHIRFDDTVKESVQKEIYARYEQILELIVSNS